MTESILGLPVQAIDYTTTMQSIRGWVADRRRPAAYLVQTNVATIVNAQRDTIYRCAVYNSSLSVPDGMPLVWMLRLKGHDLRARVYGPDLMLLMSEEAAKQGWRCFLYGGMEGVPEMLQRVLESRFPGINIVGKYSPPFRPLTREEDEKVCDMINSTKPDIVWVGLGSPKQDIWMYEHYEKLDASVLHGVGAAFDFLTGRVQQAPRWIMNIGLEWLFRLAQEPKRLWRRYTYTNILFLYYLLKAPFLKQKRSKT